MRKLLAERTLKLTADGDPLSLPSRLGSRARLPTGSMTMMQRSRTVSKPWSGPKIPQRSGLRFGVLI